MMIYRNPLKILVVLLCAALVPTAALCADKKSTTAAYLQQLRSQRKDRVIVRFDAEIDPAVVTRYGGKVIRKLNLINAVVCEIGRAEIELLKHEQNIQGVFPDVMIAPPEPIEPTAQDQGVGPLDYEGPVTVRWNNLQAGLNSKSAWDSYDLAASGVKIAFVDTGANYSLQNLDDNYLGGYDFVDDDNDPMYETSGEVHGTEVVSLAVGEGVNEVVGVAYHAGYYVVRVMDAAGGLVSDAISGIEWAATEPHRADVISMSFIIYDQPGSPTWPAIKQAFEDVCNEAYDAGVILVAGSGNDACSYPGYPADFNNVVAVGGHAQDQSLYSQSNGGVDVVAPGVSVYTVKPDNSPVWLSGTSVSAPHVSGLLGLQLQYAEDSSIEANNGYHWELMKHAAVDLAIDPLYQGEGKIYAAQRDANDSNVGSVDLLASNWPVDYDFEFSDFAFIDANIPVYQIGSDVNQTITLTNITDVLGNSTETIEDLVVTAAHVHVGEPNEPVLPGDSIKVSSVISQLHAGEANSITFSYIYTIPPQTKPGVKKTKIRFELSFAGEGRALSITYHQPDSFWYAAIPGDLDLQDDIDFVDYGIFAGRWKHTDCTGPDWCGRADINRSGDVDWADLRAIARNWLTEM